MFLWLNEPIKIEYGKENADDVVDKFKCEDNFIVEEHMLAKG